eukprot:gnl/TRDRNA2_/TRDRNA2_182118_c0_seq1.p1 gnl/TRDRNA2_/TRDRNA2_182118_c0~~gnl/TRDRNA2_/TRDRNA2_182118_c0_seq1.p1  ORF type:complete len:235 (+),score=37.90 gnl/TRDRNA2_/TRDRNA2_182118_c0_seq1:149-853(+)
MAFERDFGTCLCIFPLKMGVGMIAMYIFTFSLFSVIGIFADDIRFQSGGYNLDYFHLPTIVGAFGLVFGISGLLGTYDDKPAWVRVFYYYMVVKLFCAAITFIADISVLHRGCEGFHNTPGAHKNAPLEYISQSGTCRQARDSYLCGALVDFAFNLYCTYQVYLYANIITVHANYRIDFGMEESVSMKWRTFNVKDPRLDSWPMANEDGFGAKLAEYGSMAQGYMKNPADPDPK